MSHEPVASADPFHGNGTVGLPPSHGLAAAWNWRKAQTGNTHPGATRPFGMASACAYSGAYPTGYGVNAPAGTGAPPRLFDRPTATGFAHFQPSGIGNTERFYNFLNAMPLLSLAAKMSRWTLTGETAHPGCYAATLAETGIRAELTAGRKSILHRYRFPAAAAPVLAIELTAGGLLLGANNRYRSRPSSIQVRRLDARTAEGTLVCAGFPIHFHLSIALPAREGGFWVGHEILAGREVLHLDHAAIEQARDAGLYVAAAPSCDTIELRIGFSFRDAAQARRNMDEIARLSFEEAAVAARDDWSRHLERIQIKGATPDRRQIFYSCLYHSLVKPADCENESPYWSDDTPFFVDFSTLWDMYKTQLPLMLAVYPERGRKLLQAMQAMLRQHGEIPNAYFLEAFTTDRFAEQASGLAVHTLADGWWRKMDGVDWPNLLTAAIGSLRRGKRASFFQGRRVDPNTHTLDLACACFAASQMAAGLGDAGSARNLRAHADTWREAFAASTGLLKQDSTYYEGSLWNYSFRLLPCLRERIALCGGNGAFVNLLDTFFGYRETPAGPASSAASTGGRIPRADRFEGLNNEPDMETPYAYIWAGRHDRTAEIVRTVLREQFATGAGGLPGNDDAGGLSSWYVWNALGLFPVTGQNLYLIGSPTFQEARVAFGRGVLNIVTVNNADDAHYVRHATLNGQPLSRAWLTVEEVERGGDLVLSMDTRPAGWAAACPPP